MASGFSRTRRQASRGVALTLTTLAVLAGVANAQAPPRRIVSLVPSGTEMLFAIGAGSRVVGVGSFDAFPPEVAGLPKVGALLDPDVERILSLKPDLMVCYASQTDLQIQLKRAGIRAFAYRHGTLADIFGTLRELGAAVGFARESDDLADRVERELLNIRKKVAGRGTPRVMLVIGREAGSLRTIVVSGGYGFLHDLVLLAGGRNVFDDVKRESLNVSTETILTRAPDVILELRYSDPPSSDALARERRSWDALPGVPAVKSKRVFLMYGSELVIPGPRVIATAVTFARALHPDVMDW